jgi:hypothetical protein
VSIVERCHALGLRTMAGGSITGSLPATAPKAEHIVMGEAEAIIGDLALDLERGTAKPRLSGQRTAVHGDQHLAPREPDQDTPLRLHDRAILTRLPLQLRVLRHHRDLWPQATHEGCGQGAG